MKGSCTLLASMVAASTVALASRDSSSHSNERMASSEKKQGAGDGAAVTEKDLFAPRFDGLRFIETLVTAHR